MADTQQQQQPQQPQQQQQQQQHRRRLSSSSFFLGGGAGSGPVRLPIPLFIPNLICYARLILSLYALNIVIAYHNATVAASAANAASASFSMMMKKATNLAGHLAPLLIPTSSLVGKGIDHLLRSVSTTSSNTHTNNKIVDSDMLAAVVVFVCAALLDLLDGYVAKKLNQHSQLGVLLDVVADNVLRTCMWVASSLLDPRLGVCACVFISIEWLTLVASQVAQAKDGGVHWKKARREDPWLVKAFFSNNFRNFWGVWGVGGLFLSPLLPLVVHTFPALRMCWGVDERGGGGGGGGVVLMLLWVVVGWVGSGRLLSLGIEVWFVGGFLKGVVGEEEERRRKVDGGGAGGGGVDARTLRQKAA